MKKRRSTWERVTKRGGDPQKALDVLDSLVALMEVVEASVYRESERDARLRLSKRDPDDWPVLACAITFHCPIWNEDTDFFGCGVAVWTSDRVGLYLSSE